MLFEDINKRQRRYIKGFIVGREKSVYAAVKTESENNETVIFIVECRIQKRGRIFSGSIELPKDVNVFKNINKCKRMADTEYVLCNYWDVIFDMKIVEEYSRKGLISYGC